MAKPLPALKHVGTILLDSFKVYFRGLPVMLESDSRCHLCGESDSPRLWVDWERAPSWVKGRRCRWQLHIGLSAVRIHQEPTRESGVRDHIDVYVPPFALEDLINILRKAIKMRENLK